MDWRFLGAISSFETPEPLNDENCVAWKGQIWPSMLELNKVWTHCEGPGVAPPPDDVDWRAEWDKAERLRGCCLKLYFGWVTGNCTRRVGNLDHQQNPTPCRRRKP